jgi:hypothetical protein
VCFNRNHTNKQRNHPYLKTSWRPTFLQPASPAQAMLACCVCFDWMCLFVWLLLAVCVANFALNLALVCLLCCLHNKQTDKRAGNRASTQTSKQTNQQPKPKIKRRSKQTNYNVTKGTTQTNTMQATTQPRNCKASTFFVEGAVGPKTWGKHSNNSKQQPHQPPSGINKLTM